MFDNRYWFCVFSPSTFNDFEKMPSKKIGFRNNIPLNRISKIRAGDRFFAYVTKLSKIVGEYEVIKSYDPADSGGWTDKTITYSIFVKPLVEFTKDDAPGFYDLCHTQSWYNKLKKKNAWTFAFRMPPRELKFEDGSALNRFLEEWTPKIN